MKRRQPERWVVADAVGDDEGWAGAKCLVDLQSVQARVNLVYEAWAYLAAGSASEALRSSQWHRLLDFSSQ
jgi:hypothetical protein